MTLQFPLTESEKKYKYAYEHGGRELVDQPMSKLQYDQLPEEKKRYYRESEKYYTGQFGNTIQDIGMDTQWIRVTRHSRYGYPVIHNHQYIEMIYVYQGMCRHFIESETMEMKEGDLCIMAPEAMHAISATQDDAVIINMMISRKLFDHSFFQLLKGNRSLANYLSRIFYHENVSPYMMFPTGTDLRIHALALDMFRESEQQDYLYEESQVLYVKQLLIHLIRNYEMYAVVSNPISHMQERNIIACISYLTINYNHVTLHDAAKFFGYSDAYLGQLLVHYTGKKFNDLITEIQMEKAGSLLREDNRSIAEIGVEIGCYDSSHFIHKFKSYYGKTPAAFRKELREGGQRANQHVEKEEKPT